MAAVEIHYCCLSSTEKHRIQQNRRKWKRKSIIILEKPIQVWIIIITTYQLSLVYHNLGTVNVHIFIYLLFDLFPAKPESLLSPD
jgi:hypothetical protein